MKMIVSGLDTLRERINQAVLAQTQAVINEEAAKATQLVWDMGQPGGSRTSYAYVTADGRTIPLDGDTRPFDPGYIEGKFRIVEDEPLLLEGPKDGEG